MNALWQWLSMGGYGYYVWPTYGLVLGVLAMNLWTIRLQRRRTLRKLRHGYQRRGF